MWVMGEAMTEHQSLINLAEILSNRVAFLVLTVLITLYTVLSVTVEKPRNFQGPLFGNKRILPVFY